jgi:5-methyltetrahydrofolate--homocysteine methyltransferase
MDDLLARIAHCIEFGKIDRQSPYPPDLRGEDGADELTREALAQGITPARLLEEAFVAGMDRVGRKFAERRIFVPQMLMAARAMSAAMHHLKPFFASGSVQRKGTFVIGTVTGDLHDIGKNLVAMMVEGSGWEVVDLGVDVGAERFANEVAGRRGRLAVGLSAMLTTTMLTMRDIVADLRARYPDLPILVGGAPVNDGFRAEIGADFYSRDPQGAVDYLNGLAAA